MSPRSSQQFEEIRQASIQKIVAAAMTLFSQLGYQQVSVSQIAKEAGISKGLMYNYFPSKEALLLHILDQVIAEMGEIMQVMEEIQDPLDKVEKMLHLTFANLKSQKVFWSSIISILTQRAVSQVAEGKLRSFFASMIAQLEILFQQAHITDARMEAYKLGALLDGIALDYIFLFQEDYPLEEMEQMIIRQYQNLKTDRQ